jgi:hypothetical protein
MQDENKFEFTNFLFQDIPSIFENSIDFSQQEQNYLDQKEEYNHKISNDKNISINNPIQESNQIKNINDMTKCSIKVNNPIENNILLKLAKPSNENNLYRKDAYYKHFKVILGNFIKSKINILKNKCFPYYSKNNFSTPNYKYTGNPKEKDNFYFLHFTIKDLLIYGKDNANQNRQYNNELLIRFIESNEYRALDKNAYTALINFLNDILENIIILFYDDDIEYNKLRNDFKCKKFDVFFKRETGISLLEKYGFIKAIKKYNS